MANKKEQLSVSLSKLILAVSMIVSLGALFGAAGYLLLNKRQINPPITIEENIKNQVGKIMELNDIKEHSLKSVKKGKIELPGQFEISKTILAENFPDFSKYADSDVWQVEFNGEIEELEYGVIFDPSGEYAIAAFKNDKRAEPGIEPLKISFYLPAFVNSEAIVGEEFLITLPANPSTGYSWEADFDENYLFLRNKDFVNSKINPEIVGAGGTEVFTFAPIKAGETTIIMNYGRPWESKPSETKVFKYNIKEKQVQNQDVSIATDKTIYEKGEIIKIFVNNGLDKSILYSGWGDRFYGIQYFKDGVWTNPNNEAGGSFQLTKKNVGETCNMIFYERSEPIELASQSNLTAQWSQKICPLGTEGPDKPKIVRYTESGKYRLVFYYGFEISSDDSFQISEPKTVYSDEFTIK